VTDTGPVSRFHSRRGQDDQVDHLHDVQSRRDMEGIQLKCKPAEDKHTLPWIGHGLYRKGGLA